MLDIKHYEMILELNKCGSLKGAAASIGITQPAATYRLNEIEKRLTVKIYYSIGRRLFLTEAGKRLLETAENIIKATQRAEEDAVIISRSESYIRWGVSGYDTIEDLLLYLPQEISSRIDICRFPTDELLSAFLEGKVDYIFENTPLRSKGIDCAPIFSDKLRFVANKNHDIFKNDEISIFDISNHPYITYSRPYQPEMEFEKIFRPSGHVPKSIREVDSVSLILKILSKDRSYMSCLSEWALNREKGSDHKIIDDDALSVDCEWYFISRENSIFTAEIEKIKSEFKKYFQSVHI